MNEKVEGYLRFKKQEELEKYEKEKRETLINLGLYEKVYSPKNAYSNGEYCFSEWDSVNSTNRYYKKVPIEITDEEYNEIKAYYHKEDVAENNSIATALTVIALVVFISGFIAGIALGNVEVVKGTYYKYTDTEFSFAIAFTYWCVSFISGTMLLAFAEIIKLLDAIKKK